MKMQQERWRSPSLGKDMTIKIYGDRGTPLIGLPARGEKCGQWEKHGMTEAISHQLENGYNQLFCIDSVDGEGLLNDTVEPSRRLMRQRQFETYVMDEVVPFVRKRNHINYLMIGGVDLGGYHAINLALKHPDEFKKAIGMSGLYDIKPFFEDHYTDDVYYNNPTDFVPNMNTAQLLNAVRNVDFRLVSYSKDKYKTSAFKMAQIFRSKLIDHKLDIWNVEPSDKWNIWGQMLKTHII